ncbi:MAG: MFS transporter [Pseudomonadota bacterium]
MRKPTLGFWQIWNISFGFFGIQIGFALQNANVSRIFQTLGASIETLPILWLAGPLTGLLVQPIIGHFSDRTWTRLGRRRPYFLAGAILTTLALLIMPLSPYLWVAAATLWILDASLNVATEPFRAFVGDMLPSEQRTRGFAMQAWFIGVGATLASAAPWLLTNLLGVSSEAPEGVVPASVRLSFFIGAAFLFASIMWTVVSTREYSPQELAKFREPPSQFQSDEDVFDQPHPWTWFVKAGIAFAVAGTAITALVASFEADRQLLLIGIAVAATGAGFLINAQLRRAGRDDNFFSHILNDLTTMPRVMRQLALVQTFTWGALITMWVYTTPAITAHHFGAADATAPGYNEGADLVGLLFATYNAVAALYSLVLPTIANRIGQRAAHAISLCAGGAGLISYLLISDPAWLFLSMVGIGIAWSSILTMPYAILSDALPARKMGVYMGIFNFFIVLPQIAVAGLMGPILRDFLDGRAVLAIVVGGVSLLLAAIATMFVRATSKTTNEINVQTA